MLGDGCWMMMMCEVECWVMGVGCWVMMMCGVECWGDGCWMLGDDDVWG